MFNRLKNGARKGYAWRYDFIQDMKKWWIHTATNGTLVVDTFFIMSGVLAALALLRELDRQKGHLNIIAFYVHRYLR